MKYLLQKFKPQKYFWLATVFFSLGLFVLSAGNAQANIVEGLLSGVFFGPVGWVIGLISGLIANLLLPIAGTVLNWVFDAGQFTKAPVVRSGWAISRDLANMGFILVFLFIGFATTLRLDSYGVKQLLPRLIIIALFINFSLVIGGVFIDMGNDIGRFFVTGGNPNADVKVGDNIMAALQITRTLEVPDLIGSNPDAIHKGTQLLIRNLAGLILTIVVAFLFLAMALIMLYRMVFLWILLILAPLAWLAYAIPNAGSYFSKWWGKFLQWAFFPVVFGFFIYLGVFTGLGFALTTDDTERRSGGINRVASEYFGENIPRLPDELRNNDTLPFEGLEDLLQYSAVVFILLFGLIQSQKWSLAGADTAMAWGKGAKNWSLGKIKSGAIRGAVFPKKVLDRAISKTPVGRGMTRLQDSVERTPVIGKVFGGAGATYARKQKALKDEKTRMKDLRTEDLEGELKSPAATPKGLARKSAALSLLAEKGGLKDEHKKHFSSLLAAGGDPSSVLGQMPTWALDKTVQTALARNSATKEGKEKWDDILSSGDDNKALKEVLPKKSADFAKLQKAAIDVNDKKATTGELGQRRIVLKYVTDQFKEGGELHGNHLTALANKTPGSYEILKKELENIKDELQKGVQKHLESGPGHVTMADDKGGSPPATAPSKP